MEQASSSAESPRLACETEAAIRLAIANKQSKTQEKSCRMPARFIGCQHYPQQGLSVRSDPQFQGRPQHNLLDCAARLVQPPKD